MSSLLEVQILHDLRGTATAHGSAQRRQDVLVGLDAPREGLAERRLGTLALARPAAGIGQQQGVEEVLIPHQSRLQSRLRNIYCTFAYIYIRFTSFYMLKFIVHSFCIHSPPL